MSQGRAPLFQYQQKSEPIGGLDLPAPDLAWQPDSPAAVRRATLAVALHPFLARAPLPIPNTPPPNGPPPGGGPPFKPRKEALGGGQSTRIEAYQQQAFATAFAPVLPIPGVTAWFPTRPPQNPTMARSFAAYSPSSGAFVSLIPLPTQTPVRFPDTIQRPALETASQMAFAGPWMSALAPPPVVWLPIAPVGIDRLTTPTAAHPAFASGPSSSAFPIPDLAWQGSFSDQVWRLTLPPSAMQAFALDTEPIPNPAAPELSWGPVYPDWIPASERLKAALEQFRASHLEPIAPPAVPELSWGPSGPTWIRDLAREYPIAHRTLITQRYDPPPPDLSWTATYADQVWRTVPVTPEPWATAPIWYALAAVAWTPTFPSQFQARTLPAETGLTFETGALLSIAGYQWRPQVPTPTYVPWLMPPPAATIVPDQGPWPCVALRIDGQTPTSLVSLASTAPALIDAAQTGTSLINIGVC